MGGHSQSDTSLFTLASHPQERIICKVRVCEHICLWGVGGQTHTGTPRHKCEEISSTPKPVISTFRSLAARKAGRQGLPLKNNLRRAVFILGRKLLPVLKSPCYLFLSVKGLGGDRGRAQAENGGLSLLQIKASSAVSPALLRELLYCQFGNCAVYSGTGAGVGLWAQEHPPKMHGQAHSGCTAA